MIKSCAFLSNSFRFETSEDLKASSFYAFMRRLSRVFLSVRARVRDCISRSLALSCSLSCSIGWLSWLVNTLSAECQINEGFSYFWSWYLGGANYPRSDYANAFLMFAFQRSAQNRGRISGWCWAWKKLPQATQLYAEDHLAPSEPSLAGYSHL